MQYCLVFEWPNVFTRVHKTPLFLIQILIHTTYLYYLIYSFSKSWLNKTLKHITSSCIQRWSEFHHSEKIIDNRKTNYEWQVNNIAYKCKAMVTLFVETTIFCTGESLPYIVICVCCEHILYRKDWYSYNIQILLRCGMHFLCQQRQSFTIEISTATHMAMTMTLLLSSQNTAVLLYRWKRSRIHSWRK